MTDQADTAPKIPLIDPTLNVKELIAHIERFQDALRSADIEFNKMTREKDAHVQNVLREAEIRRHDDLAAQKAVFDQAQATTLRLQVEHNATLFLAQMDRGFAGVNERFSQSDERIAKLEQFRYESSGKGIGASAVMAYVLSVISMMIAAASVALAIFRH